MDIIPLDHTWPRLRTIALAWIYVTHAQLVSLLQINASRMRYVYLSDLMVHWRADGISPRGQWWWKELTEAWKAIYNQVSNMSMVHGHIEGSSSWPTVYRGSEARLEVADNHSVDMMVGKLYVIRDKEGWFDWLDPESNRSKNTTEEVHSGEESE